jgi:hypothetical protein
VLKDFMKLAKQRNWPLASDSAEDIQIQGSENILCEVWVVFLESILE